RLLHDVLGVLRRTEHPVTVDLKRPPVRLHQLAEGPLIARLRAGQQAAKLVLIGLGGSHFALTISNGEKRRTSSVARSTQDVAERLAPYSIGARPENGSARVPATPRKAGNSSIPRRCTAPTERRSLPAAVRL